MIESEKLLEQRKKTTISGTYLSAWNKISEYFKDRGKMVLEEYIVTFDEDAESFLVKFSKPFSEPVLGGGIGTCTVNKKSQEVKCNLIR